MYPEYVVHCMEGRARLRHPLLRDAAFRERARAALVACPGVREVRCGHESLLVFWERGTDAADLWARLEQELPGLRAVAHTGRHGAQAGARPAPAGAREAFPAGGLSLRRLELRLLAALFALCAGSGLLKPGQAHLLSGLVCAGLTLRHMWVRRRAL